MESLQEKSPQRQVAFPSEEMIKGSIKEKSPQRQVALLHKK